MRWRRLDQWVRGPSGRLTEGGAQATESPRRAQPSENSAGAALQPPPFALGKASPDTEPLVVAERVLQAFGTDVAPAADPLCLPGRPALLREESLRVGLGAQRLLLPGQQDGRLVVGLDGEAQFCHDASSRAGSAPGDKGPGHLRRDLAGAVASGRGKNTSEITRAS